MKEVVIVVMVIDIEVDTEVDIMVDPVEDDMEAIETHVVWKEPELHHLSIFSYNTHVLVPKKKRVKLEVKSLRSVERRGDIIERYSIRSDTDTEMRNTVDKINTVIKRHDEENTVIERHDKDNTVIERYDEESSVIERYGEVETYIIKSNESYRIQELNKEYGNSYGEREYRNPC
ncbi:hypothetical protein BDZ91DRAFT_792019 [Kalaharituber pfeilii]|nr:hypothetical protein BDZ91DRAFT_792019 [Kalaharituber pfeilii]